MEESKQDTEWWWIDYLENELDASLENDLQLLLEHSAEDRDSFENFRLLKQWVRESDPLTLKEGQSADLETRLRRVHSNVMTAVMSTPPPDETVQLNF